MKYSKYVEDTPYERCISVDMEDEGYKGELFAPDQGNILRQSEEVVIEDNDCV